MVLNGRDMRAGGEKGEKWKHKILAPDVGPLDRGEFFSGPR